MSNFSEWWDALSLPLKFYWALAIPFTIFFVIQLLFSMVGHDTPDDSHIDTEISGDTGMPFQFLTLKNMVAFFTLFGWAGIAAIDSGLSPWTAFIMASIVGLFMMVVMATILYLLAKANANGVMKFRNAVGETGEVYLTVPANRLKTGQVQVKVQGVLRTLDAVTDDENDIPTGRMIKVMKVAGNNLLVVTAE
jgi:membrane protein implicated in regulation of membrane protease activity